ncbi:glutathione binding-like protein [Gallaecimonas kandeliae]|uniref:glutathione S-transferase family protein n=1 Tax=Gallaecimonas kandeliae TaxID=3029055 RepID=UPI002647A5AB|nr:glutathione binding-like protein [Gallaecimonas kandeliae]WKE66447.1 glutathione binding-like protein [Gallaecimonas kandeliae]
MASLWPIQYPERLQLYTLDTPNGQKVSVALEELGIPYEVHCVSFRDGQQHSPEFLAINPNNKIPAIVDPNGPQGELKLFESGAILWYLAEKTGQLLPADPARRIECIQWLFFQMANVGPMFGQFGHFHRYAADQCLDPYPKERYRKEVRRLLAVLEQRLEGSLYLMGDDYSIADIATFPWIDCLGWHYDGYQVVALDDFPAVMAWFERCMARPASQRGMKVGA